MMTCEKMAGLDRIAHEFLTKGGKTMLEGLKRTLNVCISVTEVSKDWRGAFIAPLYKSKGEKMECLNYRRISLLNIPYIWESDH